MSQLLLAPYRTTLPRRHRRASTRSIAAHARRHRRAAIKPQRHKEVHKVVPKMRKLLSRPGGASSAVRSRDFCLCFVLEGENGGQVEVRGVPGPSRSSAVHSPSSRAYQSARQGEFSFVVSGPATACWSGVVFLFFFVGAPGAPGVRSAGMFCGRSYEHLFRRQVLLGERP